MRTRSLFLALGILATACGSAEEPDSASGDNALTMTGVSPAERAAYLASAQIALTDRVPGFTPEQILKGPPGKNVFALNEEVACDFVEPDIKDQLGGMTPKFACKLPNGEVVKVKYSRGNNNDEVYSETLASRLLWSIGLPADRMYPVRVTCRNCPVEPWAAYVQTYGTTFNKLRFREPGARDTRRFEAAALELKFDAAKIARDDGDTGWGWDELPARPAAYWDMNRTQRAAFDGEHPEQVRFDALRLYAAWAKHADNKASNQRLVCLKQDVGTDGKCAKPLLMIQDMGITFGGGTDLGGLHYEKVAKASLAGWTNQSKSPVWKDFSKCQASLKGSAWSGTLDHPRVSNVGRAVLTERLGSLSKEQLTAIFQAARIEEKKETWTDPATGQERLVTVDDWVHGFQTMVGLIDKECPE